MGLGEVPDAPEDRPMGSLSGVPIGRMLIDVMTYRVASIGSDPPLISTHRGYQSSNRWRSVNRMQSPRKSSRMTVSWVP